MTIRNKTLLDAATALFVMMLLTNGNMLLYYIHQVWIWGILQSDWFSTNRISAHILLVGKNKMAAQIEFPTFCMRTRKRHVVRFFIAFYRIKNTMKRPPQIVYRLANDKWLYDKFTCFIRLYFCEGSQSSNGAYVI